MTATLCVNTNGFLTLAEHTCAVSGTNCNSVNSTTPPGSNNVPPGKVAVFWDDLVASSTQPSIFWEAYDPDGVPGTGDESALISWENMDVWSTASNNPFFDLSFQVLLTASGDLEYRFGDMIATGGNTTTQNFAKGSSATTWLEYPTGEYALRVNANSAGNSSNPGITANTRWEFTYAP